MHWWKYSLSLICPDTQMAVIEWSNYNRICKSPIHSDEPCVGRGAAVRGGQTRTKQLTFSAATIVPELMKSQIRTSDCEGWTGFLAAPPPGWDVGVAGRGVVTWSRGRYTRCSSPGSGKYQHRNGDGSLWSGALFQCYCLGCVCCVCESKGALCT